MGIRKKIFFGFVIIAFILFLSGLVSVFQLVKIERTATGIVSDNLKSIDISKGLIAKTEDHAWEVFQIILDQKTGNEARLSFDEGGFAELIKQAEGNITAPGELEIIDTLNCAYNDFKSNSLIMDSLLMTPDLDQRIIWFNNYYKPALLTFLQSIKNLRNINHGAISINSMKLENDFYHMIMPLIIAVCVGLFLIILFNYFVNIYFVNPILSIQKGLNNAICNKTPYKVKIDTNDEIHELNDDVKIIIEKSKKKETIGIFNLNKQE